MPQEKYNLLLMQRGGKYGWESMVNPDLQISNLDENAIIGAISYQSRLITLLFIRFTNPSLNESR